MHSDFDDKTVIVTGASQGIGAAISRTYAAAGANVVVHYRRSKEPADEIVTDISKNGGSAIAIAAALNEPDDVDSLFSTVTETFGNADVLINNAGSFPNSPLLDIGLDDWQRMYSDNVESTFLSTKAASNIMKNAGGGSIINIASTSALNPGTDHAHYNSSKAAVVMFTQSAAQELGQYNIRVNAIAPGLVNRPGLEEQWPDGFTRYCNAAPLSCVVQPEDIANACLFLSSDKAARITGITLPVDAGVLTAMVY
ncbi:MAG: SDR family oxidoreductase [Gammaproteobacteria bacterium]|nr:SDR family oxidoreductase [Gammaproteobacteria bacterium]